MKYGLDGVKPSETGRVLSVDGPGFSHGLSCSGRNASALNAMLEKSSVYCSGLGDSVYSERPDIPDYDQPIYPHEIYR